MNCLSIIIPVLNEAQGISESLQRLQSLRQAGHELIVVDGGSKDNSQTCAVLLADHVIVSAPGRAQQMNAGAAIARGEILLFLHADTRLPEAADQLIANALQQHSWGRFDVQLSGSQPLFRLIERLMNLRSRLSGIATGDQAIFMWRDVFERIDGFASQDLMEDIEISRRLKKLGNPACLGERVVTSSRRWEQNGILRTVLLMWGLRLAYFCGVPAQRLARVYYG